MSDNEESLVKEVSIGMALVDYLPEVTFLTGGIIIFCLSHSWLFLIGIIVSTLAGLSKATWKLLLAITKKDNKWMTKAFHILLPAGFVIMLVGIPFNWNDFVSIFKSLFRMPSLIFVIIGCLGIVLMTIFAFTLDKNKGKSNWIEQITNTIAQLFFVLALFLI